MKYCIEVYTKYGLVNIESDYACNTLKQAKIRLQNRIDEQIEDNKFLVNHHINELKESLFDINTDDTLPNLTPFQYRYTFKIGKYTNKEVRLMP